MFGIYEFSRREAKQAAMGWKILNNDHVILHHHGDSIALAGVENSGNPPFPNYGDLQKALKGTEGMYKILMSHDPTHWHREVLPEMIYRNFINRITMTKSALGTEKQRKINKKLLSRCMESGRGSCIEKTNVIPNKRNRLGSQ